MIDYTKEIKAELDKILPTYPELFVNSKCVIPCITYRTNNNYDVAMANEEYGFSMLSYIIKLWGNKEKELIPYKIQIDSAMRKLGFARTITNELTYNNQLQIVLTYNAIGYENNNQETN